MSSEKKCCVPGCSGNSDSHTVLHLFPNPANDIDRFTSWVFNIGGDILKYNNEYIYKNRRVCHAHFEPKYCCRYNRISNIAIPTLSLPGLSTMKFINTSTERRPLKSFENVSTSTSTVSTTSTERSPLKSIENVLNFSPSTSKVSTTSTERSPLKSIENVLNFSPSTSKVCTTSTERSPLKSVENVLNISPSTSKVSTTSTERSPLKSIENVLNFSPSTSKVCTTSTERSPLKSVENVLNISPSTSKAGRALKKTTFLRSKMTKTEHELYIKLVDVKMKLSKYKNKSKKQAAELKSANKLFTNSKFIKAIESMPSTGRLITLMQFRENKKKDKGRRFSEKEKIVSLSIFKQSPKAYRFLRKIFILPSPQTLGTLLSHANIGPGLNKNVFFQLKARTNNMQIIERLCIFLFDEMALKPSLSFNTRKDIVTGFVTDGEETRPIFADHAQVFMIRGLIKNYKQPVAYTFSSGATKGPELAKQIKTVIKELQDAGFIVLATVCDQGANNRSAIKILTDEAKRMCLQKGEIPKDNYNIIQINNQEIIPLYDPPHLLKGIRNNLLTKSLKFEINSESKTAEWHHLELLMKENPAYKGIRLVPKLTENHIDGKKISKMKVKYAAQVFSQTVASNMGYLADKGILPENCKDTADLLLFFDELFDSVNGSYANKKKFSKPLLQAVKPNSAHHKKWMEFKKTLKTMKFYKGKTIENVPTLNSWVWTLEGIQILIKKLEKEYNVTSVWMRHLNQDPLENFFGAIRSHGCRNVNPTPDAFQSAYAALLVNNLSSVHAPGANCQKDYCESLVTLVTNKDCEADKITQNININKILNTNVLPLEEKADPKIMAPLQYVSGYIIKKSKKIYKNCSKCNEDLIEKNELEYIRYREYSKKRWLCSPTKSVITLVSAFQDIITDELKENLEIKNIGEYIKTLLYISADFKCLKCKLHNKKLQEYMANLAVRFFIFNYCKTINKILTGKQETCDDTDKYQLMAKNYHKKHCKRPHSGYNK